ncbi:uncharacterized protein LOC131854795 [Achroia grisella]|uniref:uncharacterized protein LOC131854795 n=1 Tax=Achroia grisella TaxID=688607 RepID=UPI0027D2A270|nr:uncharacterized protein LOC131854795 [Achroia grisella]
MVNEELLQDYSNSIQSLKRQCIERGMSEEEFKNLYYHSLNSIEIQNNSLIRNRSRLAKKHILLLAVLIIICFVYNYKFLYSCLVCNLQEYIYPGLRLLRRISIPFISLFPSLTDYYHETCLIQNPFFTVVDMDCWPCSTIHNVGEVQNPKPVTQQLTAPFIYETDQQVINMEALKDMYEKNRNIFDKESSKILANNKHYISPSIMFSYEEEAKSLYTCGSRKVHLVPAEECKHQCKTLKVDLKETYLLWYNWWYWRPVLQPSFGNETLIAHVGSYC